MSSDEGEGESITEGQWREGSVCTFLTAGVSTERLSTSPHYCLPEHTPEGEEERKRRGGLWGQKSARRVKTVFNVLPKLTFNF